MRRLLKSKLFIIGLVAVVFLALAAVSSAEGSSVRAIGNIVSVPIAPLQRAYRLWPKRSAADLIILRM